MHDFSIPHSQSSRGRPILSILHSVSLRVHPRLELTVCTLGVFIATLVSACGMNITHKGDLASDQFSILPDQHDHR